MITANKEDKQKLIEKIERTDDKKLIDEVYRLLEIDFEETVYETNKEQQSTVNEARHQIENGEVLSEENANEEINKWLKK
jgi:adenylate kinase family enzyme